jgi:hypothetical protein
MSAPASTSIRMLLGRTAVSSYLWVQLKSEAIVLRSC